MFKGKLSCTVALLMIFLSWTVADFIFEGCKTERIYGDKKKIEGTTNDTLLIARDGLATEIEAQDGSSNVVSLTLPGTFPETLTPVTFHYSQTPKLTYMNKDGVEETLNFTANGNSLELSKGLTLTMLNGWATEQCKQELPYIVLKNVNEVSLPIPSDRNATFIVTITGDKSIDLSFEKISLCWNSEQDKIIGMPSSSSPCQNLPLMSRKCFKFVHEKSTNQIKINGEVVNGTFNYNGVLKFSSNDKEEGRVFVAQCIKDCSAHCTAKQGTVKTTQLSPCSTVPGSSEIVPVILGVLFGISIVIIAVLSLNIWKLRRSNDGANPNSECMDSADGEAPIPLELHSTQPPTPRQEHHYNECVETINDEYEPFDAY